MSTIKVLRTDEEIVELLSKYHASGLKPFVFCKENNIPSSSFHGWLSREEKINIRVKNNNTNETQKSNFINISSLELSKKTQLKKIPKNPNYCTIQKSLKSPVLILHTFKKQNTLSIE